MKEQNEIMITDSSGQKVSAMDILRETAPAIILGLEAAKALAKNMFVRMAIGIVKTAIESLVGGQK